MGYSLGIASRNILSSCDPKLVACVNRAIDITEQDFAVVFGRRTLEQQYELYAKGRSVDDLRKAGVPSRVLARPGEKQVTWTLHSRHFPDPKTGLGNAVDLAAFPIDYTEAAARQLQRYLKIKAAMFQAAEEQGIQLRWGGDWNRNGVTEHGEDDFGHFELVQTKEK